MRPYIEHEYFVFCMLYLLYSYIQPDFNLCVQACTHDQRLASTRTHRLTSGCIYNKYSIQKMKYSCSIYGRIRYQSFQKKHTYVIPCPYIQCWQPEDKLTIPHPILRWTYMEVGETKETFLIFLVFSHELDLALHHMTFTYTSHFIVYVVIPPHHRIRHV